MVFKKLNTNFDLDSFREATKLKANAINKLQKASGNKIEELKCVSKFFTLLLKGIGVSGPRAQLKSFAARFKAEENLANIKYILNIYCPAFHGKNLSEKKFVLLYKLFWLFRINLD